MNYYKTRSKTLAYALNFIGYTFYKFHDDKDIIIYSFEVDEKFYEKLRMLEDIKFN